MLYYSVLYKLLNSCYIYCLLHCTWIYVSNQCYLLGFFVNLVWPQLFAEHIPLGLIENDSWEIGTIEVIFASTYKTTTKIDKETDGRIILLIVWLRYICFKVSLHFYAVVAFIIGDRHFCLQILLELYIWCSMLRQWWLPLWSWIMFRAICKSPSSELQWPSIRWL